MKYAMNDILIASIKGVEQPVRVAGCVDDTKPILVNVRVSDGLRWGERRVKIASSQILRADPTWEQRRRDKWEADLQAYCEEAYAKMSPARRKELTEAANRRRNRSPLDILIDRACGIE